MTETLVERLRSLVIMDEVGSDNPLGRDAADLISSLQSERDELREVLGEFRSHPKISGCRPIGPGPLSSLFDRIDATLTRSASGETT